MTIYNRTQFYKAALDSLANQTDNNFELLIFSNVKIDYNLKKFNSVKIFQAPESVGEMYAMAIRESHNDKIAFLDDDDVFSPDKVKFLNNTEFGYLHNDYYSITKGDYNSGKGFNMSCIAICRSYFLDLPEELENNMELSKLIDSFIYWFALENDISITITDKKLTGYRFRDYKTLQRRVIDDNKRQLEYLKLADNYFKSEEVKRIIKSKIISNEIFLNSYGIYTAISLKDVLWLLKQKDVNYKMSKVISYILSLPLWNGKGVEFIKKLRDKKSLS